MHNTIAKFNSRKIIHENISLKMRLNLLDARQQKGLTQTQIALQIGISCRTYQKMEAGAQSGHYKTWDALEQLLGVQQQKLREVTSKKQISRNE